jgi:4'-phosphopantetheinyl transferase
MNTMVAMRPSGWVDVWIDRLDLPPIEVAALTQFLTTAELAMCDRCRLDHVRQHKIVARARLRQILGKYLARSPLDIDISLGIQGKPQVAGLEFNLSHSGDFVAYAISDRPVGIDIEQVRAMDLSGIVQRFFAPSEFIAWQKLSPTEQELAFFRTWTVKEAYLKAIGTGLHTPLSEVEVSIDLEHPKILQAPGSENWQLHSIKNLAISLATQFPGTSESIGLPSGYVGALITTGDVDNIKFMKSR